MNSPCGPRTHGISSESGCNRSLRLMIWLYGRLRIWKRPEGVFTDRHVLVTENSSSSTSGGIATFDRGVANLPHIEVVQQISCVETRSQRLHEVEGE